MNNIIVIVGPTGVGKTKLSIELAKMLDGEIINGDSVAIYRGLDIGSAKPLDEERCGILHHLIDIKDVWEDYSVFNYQRDVRRLINDITARGKRVIIVGGTGLYIKAALYDYKFSKMENSSDFSNYTNQELYDKIASFNIPFDVHINNRQRLVRLLNKLENGEEFSKNRDKLYERINKRVDLMMENGLLDEVMSLKKYYPKSRILNSAIGYKEFSKYFKDNEELDLESIIFNIKQDSRRFAKRQYTFFNHQFNVKWYDADFDDFSKTITDVYNDVKEKEV